MSACHRCVIPKEKPSYSVTVFDAFIFLVPADLPFVGSIRPAWGIEWGRGPTPLYFYIIRTPDMKGALIWHHQNLRIDSFIVQMSIFCGKIEKERKKKGSKKERWKRFSHLLRMRFFPTNCAPRLKKKHVKERSKGNPHFFCV